MKKTTALLVLLALVITGCIKSIAGDDDLVDAWTFHHQKVGASAADLLRDERYTSLRIEVQYMPGFAPDRAALRNLQAFLVERLHKPGGIYITTKKIASAADSLLTLEGVMAIERANRTAFMHKGELAVYILYTDGYFANSNILGWAYLNTSAVLFGKKIEQHAQRPDTPDRTILETNVLKHELGHLLGLVNVGTPLQSGHKDDKHGKHCSNRRCLMYYVVDSKRPFRAVLKTQLPELDEACLDDLRANGGR